MTAATTPVERAGRQPVRWAARVGRFLGRARDYSATGMFIELADPIVVGSPVDVVLDLEFNGERLKMLCSGDVVRTEQTEERRGIGIRFNQPAKIVPVG